MGLDGVHVPDANASGVEMPTLSPDSHYLAAASHHGRIMLWNLRELREQLRELGLDWD